MSRLSSLLFLLFCSTLCFGQAEPNQLDAAGSALRAGRFNEVLDLLSNVKVRNLEYHYLAGLALEELDSLTLAADHWRQYLKLASKDKKAGDYERSIGYFCLANNHLLQGDLGGAETALKASLDPSNTLPDTLSAKIWNSYGALKVQQNDSETARAAFEKAVEFWQAAGRLHRAVLPRFYLARYQLWLNPALAVEQIRMLLDLPIIPLDDLHPAMLHLTLSEAYFRQGKVPEARGAYNLGLAQIARFKDKKVFSEEVYRQSLDGLLQLQEGQPGLAVEAFTTVDTITEATILPTEEMLYFRGLSDQYVGNYQRAIQRYRYVLDSINPPGEAFKTALYQRIGECFLEQNQYKFSVDNLRLAKEREDANGLSAKGQTDLLLAEALLGNREVAAARSILQQLQSKCTTTEMLQTRVEVCLGLAELHQQTEGVVFSEAILDKLEGESEAFSPLNRARWLAGKAYGNWEDQQFEAAAAFSQQSITALLTHWSTLKGLDGVRLQRNYFDRIFRLGVSCALATGDARRAVWVIEVARALDVKGELLANLPKRSVVSETAYRDYLGLISNRLTDQQTLIYYLNGLDTLYAVVIDHTNGERIIPLGNTGKLEESVKTYLGFIGDSVTKLDLPKEIADNIYGTVCSYSHELYLQLIEPLNLEFGTELLVVPDSYLEYLPLSSLIRQLPTEPNAFDQHDYLIRHHAIAYLPTVGLLLGGQVPTSLASYPLLTFAPEYGLEASLEPLLNNQKEAARLEASFKGNFHYGKQASRDRLPNAGAAAKQLLHLSMHATFDPSEPDSSLLAFAGEEVMGKPAWYYAHEIEEEFHQYPFIFLSACQTANGKHSRGDGALSLTRSLMARGNHHLVSSLWNVDDGKVGKLVHTFYQALVKNGNTVKGLQAAQIAYLDNAKQMEAYPYYWAGFFHYGLSAQVAPRKKLAYGWFLLPVAVGGLLLLGSFAKRKGHN